MVTLIHKHANFVDMTQLTITFLTLIVYVERVHFGGFIPVSHFTGSRFCGTIMPFDAQSESLNQQILECEARVASFMWVLGVIRRGVDWKEDSPILRLIDRTMEVEFKRESQAPLGDNVARMTAFRPAPAQYPGQYPD